MRKIVPVLLSLVLLLSLSASTGASPFLASPAARTVLVNLVDAGGQPVKNAEVHLLTPGVSAVKTARTDDRGQAVLSMPDGFSFWLRVWAEGHALIERPYVPSSDGPVLTLQASAYTAMLTGLITDDRSMPVHLAQVSLYRAGYGLEATVMTNALGVYTVTGLRADGAYTLQVEAQGFRPVSEAAPVLNPNSRNQQDLSLTRSGGAVTGEVVDSRNGRAVSGMKVELLLSDWGVVGRATTDALGYFAVDAPPSNGTYQVRISRSDFETTTTATFTVTPGSWVDFSGSSRISANRLYAQISGMVLDNNAKAMPQTPVHLQRQDLGTVEIAVTDQNGRYKFTQIPGGTYRVRAYPQGDLVRGDSGWLTVTGGQSIKADLDAVTPDRPSFGPETLGGTVKDHLGEPVKGATVTVHRGTDLVEATTNEDGQYEVELNVTISDDINEDDATGYHVQVQAPGYLVTDQPTGGNPPSLVTIQKNFDNQANFTLQPERTMLAGRVMNEQGQALEGVRVALVQEGRNQLVEVSTDKSGRYRFNDLPVAKQGRYMPAIVDPAYLPGAVAPDGTVVGPSTLSPETPETFTLVARSATTLIQGLVQAGDDLPAKGAQVTVLRPADGKTYTVEVGNDGSYQVKVPAIPDDQHLVRVSYQGAATNASTTVTAPAADARGALVNLTVHPTAVITGRVFGQDGQPLANTRVVLYAEGSATLIRSAQTDNTGRYRFGDLTPGRRYAVSVSDDRAQLSALAPGELIITPLIALPSGETQWADLQANPVPNP